jgi:hypothetical protein
VDHNLRAVERMSCAGGRKSVGRESRKKGVRDFQDEEWRKGLKRDTRKEKRKIRVSYVRDHLR